MPHGPRSRVGLSRTRRSRPLHPGAELDFVIPGDPAALTGGYEYARRLVAGLRDARLEGDGARARRELPGARCRRPRPCARGACAHPRRPPSVRSTGSRFGAMPDLATAEARRLRLVGLVHHPLAEETGLEPTRAEALRLSEARALTAVRRVIVTSARDGACAPELRRRGRADRRRRARHGSRAARARLGRTGARAVVRRRRRARERATPC